jgi:hypothetical protein
MIQFNLPNKLNGAQLVDELKAAGVSIIEPPMVENGDLFLDIATKDEVKAKTVVNSHVGIDKEPTLDDKLSSVGVSIADLKTALGL